MKAFTINYNENTDVTQIKFSDDFTKSHWVTRADILKDAVYIVKKEYEKVLQETK